MERLKRTLALVALGLFLPRGVAQFVDVDVWHQMALWRETLALGYLPLQASFAYTPTVPVIQHEWGMGALLYVLATHGGIAALKAVQLALVAFVGAGTFRLASRRGATLAVLCPLAPLITILAWTGFTAVRAQLLTLAFLVSFLWALERDRAGERRWIAWWLVLYLLWVNVHAGFVVGLGLLGAYTLEQAIRGQPVRHLLAVGVAMAMLVAVNPYGFAYYPKLWSQLTLHRALIAEWAPAWQGTFPGVALFFLTLSLALYPIAIAGPRAAVGWPLLVLAAEEALRHQRHVSIYAVVWLAYVPAWIEMTPVGEVLRSFWARRSLATVAMWSLIFVGAASGDIAGRVWELHVPATASAAADVVYPAGAVGLLAAIGFAGNLLVPFEYGAYVSWNLSPKVKVSLDSRYEVAYPPETIGEQREFYTRGARWRAVLERYPTDAILVPRGAPVEQALRAEAAWPLAYQDDAYLIFARRDLGLAVVDRRGTALSGQFP